MEQIVDIPYTSDPKDSLLCFDLHVPPSARDGSMIIFVHGGAWGGGDKSKHQELASQLAMASRFPVLVPNYRLTTNANKFRHPGHAEDILRFLEFLTSWEGTLNTTGRGMYLVGQSAGAHILASIFLDSPSLTPSPAVLRATRGIVLVEGIYDIDLLLARFPAYRDWFIAAAFDDRQSYLDVSTTRLPLRNDESAQIRWLVVHSTGDTLVDLPQSESMYEHLRALYGEAASTQVARTFDQLDMEHDDVLDAPLFIEIVRAFLEGSS
ncbi:Alpha/Beta hydrolase protein [Mycena alexandri]|uniref:Alpha/Beta hydrolase protein n=1 Tax=Mycena alexandri TaxID=1745969 RepID=A0AAD6XFY0_9AGAR|nr:Alpha/Beta hydrolase protein [Mycena alexandri]